MGKILIVSGGGIKHIAPFNDAADELNLKIDVASFAKLEYFTEEGKGNVVVKVDGKDVADYNLVYLRLVGKRYEDAALLVYYCRQNGVRIVDNIFEKDGIIRIPLPKSLEAKLLKDKGLPIPKTYFGRIKMMRELLPKKWGFPFVIKGTTGKQGHAVWSPRNMEELEEMVERFTPLEKKGEQRFIAQEFIKASQRNRVFVIGEEALAAITRPTRWRKRFLEKVKGKFPEGKKEAVKPIPQADAKLAVESAKALGITIGGVDILTEDSTGKKYIIEVNSAPRWASLKKDTGINIEKEILKYLATL